MKTITILATKMLAVLSIVAMIASPAAAQGLSAADLAFAFGSGTAAAPQTARAAAPALAEPVAIASARGMTQAEMHETEGALLPAFAIGVFALNTGRFIATRFVSRTVAVNAARSGCNVMCFGTRQQARSLATQAYGRGNFLRHGPSGHTRSHVDYSHFQSRSGTLAGKFSTGTVSRADAEPLEVLPCNL